jgi:hypothetical protein
VDVAGGDGDGDVQHPGHRSGEGPALVAAGGVGAELGRWHGGRPEEDDGEAAAEVVEGEELGGSVHRGS